MANPQVQTLIFAAGSPNGISLAQQPLAAGNLTITGALASGGSATLDAARRVVIVSGGSDESGKTFTIYGTSRDGVVQSEVVTGPGAGLTVISVLDYLTVTRIAVSAATTGNVNAGTSDATTIGSGPWLALNIHITPAMIEHWCSVASANPSNYSIEFTPDDPNVNIPPGGTAQVAGSGRPQATIPWPGSGSIEPNSFSPPQPWPHKTIFKVAVAMDEVVNTCAWAWRLTIHSGTTAVTAQGIQAGIIN